MVEKSAFENYFDNRFNVFRMRLLKTNQLFQEEDLHQMRVEIKKMRSLFGLMQILFPDGFENKKFKKRVRKLFKPGGKLRETQLNIRQVDLLNIKDLSHYRNYLSQKSIKQIEKLKLVLQSFIVEELEQFESEFRDFIKNHEFDHLRPSVEKFVSSELTTVGILFPQIDDPEILHRTRRYLKSSGYALKLYQDLWFNDDLTTLHEKIKIAESIIGDWHDKIVFKQSVINFALKYPDQFDPSRLNSFNLKLDGIIHQYEENIANHIQEVTVINPF